MTVGSDFLSPIRVPEFSPGVFGFGSESPSPSTAAVAGHFESTQLRYEAQSIQEYQFIH